MRNAERKALHALSLEDGATGADIKARFKELAKRHHPDANGGDRTSEDKLREIIEAYNDLEKTATHWRVYSLPTGKITGISNSAIFDPFFVRTGN